jgi:hypothetical protein
MKKLFFVVSFILMAILLTNAGETWISIKKDAKSTDRSSVSALKEDVQKIPLSVDVTGFNLLDTIIGGKSYNQIRMPGAGLESEVGKPELPVIRKFIQIPLGSKAEISDLKFNKTTMDNYILNPVQTPIPEIPNAKTQNFVIDNNIYAKDEIYPKNIVKLGSPTIFRGIQVIPVEIYPLQYNPVKKQIIANSEINFSVKYSGEAPESEVDESEAAYNEVFAPLLDKTILNYKIPSSEKIKRWNDKFVPLFIHLDYLIITYDKFFNNIKPLADAKTAKGLKVKIVKTSEIGVNPSAADIAAYIKTIYRKTFPRLTYVLLVGDVNLIPVHYVTNNSYEGTLIGTDLYYSTMYNPVNGVPDYTPDVALGRLPAKTPVDVDNMVKKILNHEKTYFSFINTASFIKKVFPVFINTMFNKILHCAYFEDNNIDGHEDRMFVQTSEQIHQYLKSLNYNCKTVYTQTTNSPAVKTFNNGSAVPAGLNFTGTTQNIIDIINGGVFFVTHRDHGDSTNGGGSVEGWWQPRFTTADVLKLKNKDKYPVFLSINCRSGWFDGETDKDGGAIKVDCLGEALMKKSEAGAAGFIGSTRVSYSGYNDSLAKGMIDALWPNFDNTYNQATTNHIGIMLNYSKMYMADDYGAPDAGNTSLVEFEQFNLLGDPEMSVKGQRYLFIKKYPILLKYKNIPYIINKDVIK